MSKIWTFKTWNEPTPSNIHNSSHANFKPLKGWFTKFKKSSKIFEKHLEVKTSVLNCIPWHGGVKVQFIFSRVQGSRFNIFRIRNRRYLNNFFQITSSIPLKGVELIKDRIENCLKKRWNSAHLFLHLVIPNKIKFKPEFLHFHNSSYFKENLLHLFIS